MSLKDDERRATQAMLERSTSGPAIDLDRLGEFVAARIAPDRSLLGIAVSGGDRKAGLSSGTLLFDATVRDSGGEELLPLVFRYDMGGTMFSQYDLPAQFHIMSAVHAAGFPVPEVLWLDAEGHVAGGRSGLVMKRVAAPAPSATPFVDGPLMAVSAERRHAMLLDAAATIGRLHQLDPDAIGVGFLATRGTGENPVAREISWNRIEVDRATLDENGAVKTEIARRQRRVIEIGAQWLARNTPDRPAELVHGDYNITNIMHDGDRVAAVLDWELTHLGIGEEDLAYMQLCIQHYAHSVGGVDGLPSDSEMIAAYTSSGRALRDFEFAWALAQWRIACISAIGFSKYPTSAHALMEQQWRFIEERLARFMNIDFNS